MPVAVAHRLLRRPLVNHANKLRALRYFDSIVSDYDRVSANGWLRHLRERERSAVLALAGMRRARRSPSVSRCMIDVGTGGGFYARRAKEVGFHVTAVDLSKNSIDGIERHVDRAWVADVESLRAHRQYDLVICAGVLDFVLQPESAFRNLADLVAPGGRLVLLVPEDGLGGLLYRLEKLSVGIRVNLFREEWLVDQGLRFGLEPKAVLRPLPTNLAVAFQRIPVLAIAS